MCVCLRTYVLMFCYVAKHGGRYSTDTQPLVCASMCACTAARSSSAACVCVCVCACVHVCMCVYLSVSVCVCVCVCVCMCKFLFQRLTLLLFQCLTLNRLFSRAKADHFSSA